MKRIIVVEKGNGYVLTEEVETEDGSGGMWEANQSRVVEGRDIGRIGAAVLALFAKPRGPRKRPAPKAVA